MRNVIQYLFLHFHDLDVLFVALDAVLSNRCTVARAATSFQVCREFL
jgi:hypothetical protein